MIRLFGISIFVLAVVALTGCGGGSSGTGVSSGLDPERIVSSLNTVEYGDVCENIRQNALAEFESNKPGFCRLTGLLSAFLEQELGDSPGGTKQICEELVGTCEAAPIETNEDEEINDCPIRQEGLAGCEATIGDIEACFGSTFELIGDVLSKFECGDTIETFTAKAQELGKITSGSGEISRECEALRSKCASLLVNPS